MSGLSHLESEGCRNLLGLLDNDEIMALCDTVTNRLVQPVDRQGRRRQGPCHPQGSGPVGSGRVRLSPKPREGLRVGAAQLCSLPARRPSRVPARW